MILQNLLPLIPRRLGAVGLTAAIGASALGCGLWLIGARFSRPLLALGATVGGGAIGFQSPQWFGWTIDPWGVAVLGSLLLGIVAFLTHRWLAAFGLGLILAAWVVVAAFATAEMPNQWLMSMLPSEVIWAKLADVPHQLPSAVAALLMLGSAGGLIGGTMLALRWPRLGMSLFWTILGLTIALASGLIAVQNVQPEYLRLIPSRPQLELFSLTGLIAVGTAAQWRLAFYKRPPRKA